MDRDLLKRLRGPGREAPEVREARELLDRLDGKGGILSPRARDVAWASLRDATLLLDRAEVPADHDLRQRLEAAQEKLRHIDRAEIDELRTALAHGYFKPTDYRARLEAMPPHEWDPFTQQLFDVQFFPVPDLDKPDTMVEYVATNVFTILEIADVVNPDDVFVDLGAGVGLVSMLVSWLTEAKSIGIEIDPAYHRHAEAAKARLKLDRVRFELADAREAPFDEGTVFYMYQPFHGDILNRVIDRLEEQANQRPIKIFSFGMCSKVLDERAWTKLQTTTSTNMAIFDAG